MTNEQPPESLGDTPSTPPPAAPAPDQPPMAAAPQAMQQMAPGAKSEKKLVAGILGILLGGFGVHKFYLGYTKEGIIQIVITILTCGLGSIIGLIEGIMYLVKSDAEFDATYVHNKKAWF